jgi:hypothetical protein
LTVAADSERRKAMTSTNTIVANAIKAQTVRNSVEVEISPGYAARVQHAMRDAARAVSGVRMTSTNTLECRDEDAADDVIDILKQAGLPDGEVWTNAKRVAAKNARLVPFDRDAVKPGDSVWYKGREFEYKGMRGPRAELEDVFDGETEIVGIFDRDLKMAANAERVARNANEWIDDPKKKKAMDEIDKKADALYRQLKDIARKFDALKNEQVKVGFYFADYSDAARQIREIHGME